jgi:Arc/MetJ-type ribon-helix-helix transcriptional regulator
VDWPSLPVGSPPVWATDWVHNTSGLPETLGLAGLVTGHTTDFRLAADMQRHTLAPGSSCSLRVGFSPRHAGPRACTLTIPINGHVDRVQLSGAALPGRSSLVNSGPDYVDQGRTYSYVDGPQQLSVRYQHSLLAFGITRVYDDAFDPPTRSAIGRIPTWYRFGMSTQIAVRLPDDIVEFIDALVSRGDATSRAAVVSRALDRERRRKIAERDAGILARASRDTDMDALAEFAASSAMDDLD